VYLGGVRRWTAAALALVFLGLGCGRKSSGDVLARVGRATLDRAEIERRLPVQLAGRMTPPELRRVVDAWVEQELLTQEALARRLDEAPQVARRLEEARREILTAELLEREMRSEGETGEEAVLAYYEAHKDEFVRLQPEVRVRHILVPERADQDRVLGRISRGELFDQVAREESIDESSERGGDLGYFTEDMVDPVFWAACADAEPNRAQQVRTRLGYHLFEVLDRREAGGVRDLLEVKSEIRQRLLSERRQALRDSLVKGARARVEVVIDPTLSEP
jgi:peptidyl-prolyl cis-trans isomerase C